MQGQNWKLIYGSVVGTSHDRVGQPCQDESFGSTLVVNEECVLIVSCADGAGSAKFAEEGSHLACQRITQMISADLQAGVAVDAIHRENFAGWHNELREAIRLIADERGATPRDFACTLLTAVIGERSAVFSQIGDGAIVILKDDCYHPVFWPQSGEYANTTNFLTDPNVDQRMEFTAHDGQLDEVALMTDGLQMLALNFSDKTAHAPFFSPLFKTLRETDVPDELSAPLRQFLMSKPVTDRTDDDKTLLMATRSWGNAT